MGRMRPKAGFDDEYIEMCRGLERMAALYKAKKLPTDKEQSSMGVGRIFRAIKRLGVKGAYRRYRVDQSGVNQILPSAETGDADRKLQQEADSYFSVDRIAVYTAEFGGYDEILEPVIHPDNIDYYLLSDRPLQTNSAWIRLDPADYIPEEYRKKPTLANRWCKMHPHVIFPQYRYSVYIDANCLVVSDFTVMINRMGDFPVAMFRHKNRECVYDEIEACRIKNKAPKKALLKHRTILESHGVPRKYGLAEATVIARKHLESECINLMEDWWQAFLAGSGRDQIALIDALWRSGIRPSQITTLGNNIYQCDLFIVMPHQKNRG